MALDGAAQRLVTLGHDVVVHGRDQQRAQEALRGVPGARSALAGCRLALSDALVSGQYFYHKRIQPAHPTASDINFQEPVARRRCRANRSGAAIGSRTVKVSGRHRDNWRTITQGNWNRRGRAGSPTPESRSSLERVTRCTSIAPTSLRGSSKQP